MRTVKRRWVSLNARRTGHGYGIVIDDTDDPLTNLRFADDILLVAQSQADASKMLSDLAKEASTYGLEIHFEKIKVLTTQQIALASLRGDRTRQLPTLQLQFLDFD